MGALEKLVAQRIKSGKEAFKPDSLSSGEYPLLVELMTAVAYPDGSVRQTATVTVFADPGGWKACLSDRDTGLTLWATAGTIESVWASLEERLSVPDPDWKQPRPGKKK